jgi:hypothetical protein
MLLFLFRKPPRVPARVGLGGLGAAVFSKPCLVFELCWGPGWCCRCAGLSRYGRDVSGLGQCGCVVWYECL